MMRGLFICPDLELSEAVEHAVTETRSVAIVRKLDHYPEELELMRLVRANAPQVLFMSTESLPKAGDLVRILDRDAPGLQVVAISRACEPSVLLDVMRFGIREFLSLPLSVSSVMASMQRVEALALTRPAVVDSTDQLLAFLPSKAGVGTSTVALNLAIALARHPNTPGLLLDMDLSSGILGFMLKLNNTHSIVEAAENSHTLDESMWPQLVTSAFGVDVIHSGHLTPGFRIESAQIRHLLDFARRHYKTICVDLSGNLERYSLEIMHEAKMILMVVTPEIPALHLAREKVHFLESLELLDRVRVVLNRSHRRSPVTNAQVEELLELPITYSFMNDYNGVHRALQAGRGVDTDSELGRQFGAAAASILDRRPSAEIDTRKRFVEYFSLLPAKYAGGNLEKKTVG